MVEALGRELELELDRYRPCEEARGEPVEPVAGLGAAALADA